MAITWVKAWNGHYYNLLITDDLYVRQWFADPDSPDQPADNLWWIWSGGRPMRGTTLTTGFATQALAQAFLDSAITQIGGSV